MHDLFGFCTPLKGKRLDCMIKLIATDMDGTFLTDDKTYDKPLFERLFDRFLEEDIKFVVASGNHYPTISKAQASDDFCGGKRLSIQLGKSRLIYLRKRLVMLRTC